jgi:hypothetical protein
MPYLWVMISMYGFLLGIYLSLKDVLLMVEERKIMAKTMLEAKGLDELEAVRDGVFFTYLKINIFMTAFSFMILVRGIIVLIRTI